MKFKKSTTETTKIEKIVAAFMTMYKKSVWSHRYAVLPVNTKVLTSTGDWENSRTNSTILNPQLDVVWLERYFSKPLFRYREPAIIKTVSRIAVTSEHLYEVALGDGYRSNRIFIDGSDFIHRLYYDTKAMCMSGVKSRSEKTYVLPEEVKKNFNGSGSSIPEFYELVVYPFLKNRDLSSRHHDSYFSDYQSYLKTFFWVNNP